MAKKKTNKKPARQAPRKPAAPPPGPNPIVEARTVPIDAVQSVGNVRSVVDVDDLVADVRDFGIRVPIIVYPGGPDGWIVEDGHRRLAAAREAGLTEIPVIVRERALSETQRIAAQAAHDLSRADLTVRDRARAIAALVQAGHNQVDIARRMGRSPGLVSQYVTIARLPDDVLGQEGMTLPKAYRLATGGDGGGAGAGADPDPWANVVRAVRRALGKGKTEASVVAAARRLLRALDADEE